MCCEGFIGAAFSSATNIELESLGLDGDDVMELALGVEGSVFASIVLRS